MLLDEIGSFLPAGTLSSYQGFETSVWRIRRLYNFESVTHDNRIYGGS